ncbi:glycerophosphodiester phosphodiesterase [Rhizobium puerariae]|uniref:Glycerophosphodiester phosphodiesterase n=1 Tax=Rhizobium puerariae TaxID=1585791 RepID=A0ABV6AEC1_9HYPH
MLIKSAPMPNRHFSRCGHLANLFDIAMTVAATPVWRTCPTRIKETRVSLLFSETGKLHICAHRGQSYSAPENTLAAFRAAVQLGASVCETDLAVTADGEFVLIHDASVDRTTNGKGLVARMTLDELRELDAGSWFGPQFAGERVPTLREGFALARELGFIIQLELKIHGRDDEILPRLAKLIDEEDAHGVVQFSSFDFAQLRRAKLEMPRIHTLGISHSRLINPVAAAREALLDAYNIEIQHFASGEAQELHEEGIAAFLTVPRPDKIALNATYGDDLEPRLLAWIAEGRMDQLCCDDAGFLARLVGGDI